MLFTKFRQGDLKAGARFAYQGSNYRLNSFLCEVSAEPQVDPWLSDLFAEWEAEEAAKVPIGMRRIKLRYCLPEEAEFVTGSGVCGCIAPIDEVELDGMVEWSESELAEHHERALAKGREAARSATIIRPITTAKELRSDQP